MSKYFVTAARGLEAVTASELNDLGATKTEVVHGGVYFEGTQETLYRAHLFLRTGNRIFLPLRKFTVKTPDDVYNAFHSFKWETFFRTCRTFSVECTISGRKIMGLDHSHYVKLRVKDAIVDRMREKTGERPDVDIEDPDLSVLAYIRDGECQLSLDATGTGLHERGYRSDGGGAPLKETLAAGLISLTDWSGTEPFLDPMCGSGTLPIEAALYAARVAPATFRRKRFLFRNWPDFYEPLWERLLKEAEERRQQLPVGLIFGADRNEKILKTAMINARRTGFPKEEIVFFSKRFEEIAPPTERGGVLLMNPPYGERLGEEEELKPLYKAMGDVFKQRFKGWRCYVFTGSKELSKCIGLKPSRRIPLFNGPIECRLLEFKVY